MIPIAFLPKKLLAKRVHCVSALVFQSVTIMAMDSLALHELNSKSAGIGAWMVKVHGMQYIEYEYTWNQKPQKGQKLECFLVASDGTYCQGTIKSVSRSRLGNGGSDPVAELRQMMKKFADGTIWKMTKVSLANEKAEYIGSPVKIWIDLRKTVCTGILQTLVKMPAAISSLSARNI